MKRWLLVLWALLILGGSAHADVLLLKDGRKVFGAVSLDGSEYEVNTDEGTLWIEKSEVKRWVKSVDELTDKAKAHHDKGRELFEQTKGMTEDQDAHNEVLRKAITELEKARDLYFEAREIYDTESFSFIDKTNRVVIQELRVYRDQMHKERKKGEWDKHESWGDKPPPPRPDPNKPNPPVEEKPEAEPIPEPAPEPAEIEEDDDPALWESIRDLINKGKVEKAYMEYKLIRAEQGKDSRAIRNELADGFLAEAAAEKKPKKAIPFYEKAVLLKPTPENYNQLRVAHYEIGKEAVLGKRSNFNEGSQSFTAAIRLATKLSVMEPNSPEWYFWRARAYYWRGFAVAKKFAKRGKGWPGQIVQDLNAAKSDFRECQSRNPDAEMRQNCRDETKGADDFIAEVRRAMARQRR
jgi:tetratricopeptide (TPR) repeat protein